MTTLLLRRHVYCRDVGAQTVFLDLKRGKYFAIGCDERAVLAGVVDGWDNTAEFRDMAISQADVIAAMFRMDLFTTDAHEGRKPETPPVESLKEELVSFRESRRSALSPQLAFTALYSVMRATLLLRLTSLAWIVECVRARKERALRNAVRWNADRDRHLVAAFNRLRPLLLTSLDRCLLDSLSLIEFLALHQSFPTWVVGVSTAPFAAHSWVQNDGRLYNGPYEIVGRYAPILVV